MTKLKEFYMHVARMVGSCLICLLFCAAVVKADIDPCPGKQQEFEGQAASAHAAWAKVNAQISAATFDPVAFQAAYRKMLEEQAVHDLQDTITSLNSQLPAQKKIHISDYSLHAAATKKVALLLNRPEGKQALANATQQAGDAFLQKKFAVQLDLANKKKAMDDQIIDAHNKLDASCTYDFPSQMVRIVSNVMSLHSSVENGVLTVVTFNAAHIRDGQLIWGDHPLMDIPVVSASGVSIGGVPIMPVPTISGGDLKIPVVPGVPPISVKLPDVSVGNGPGLGVHIGSWSF